jgi:hypothetical protein
MNSNQVKSAYINASWSWLALSTKDVQCTPILCLHNRPIDSIIYNSVRIEANFALDLVIHTLHDVIRPRTLSFWGTWEADHESSAVAVCRIDRCCSSNNVNREISLRGGVYDLYGAIALNM